MYRRREQEDRKAGRGYDAAMALRTESRLQASLADIAHLLDRHRVLETLTHRQQGPRRDLLEQLQHRQNLAELNKHLCTMHVADVAYVLEALPLDDRRVVWDELAPAHAGRVFVEVSSAVRESLADIMPRERLKSVLSTLDPEDIGYVSESLPPELVSEVSQELESGERSVLEDSVQYEEDSVGHYMTREWVAVPDTFTVEQTLADLRTRTALPPQTDRLFVTDARSALRGTVALQTLVLQDPATLITGTMTDEIAVFSPEDSAGDAVKAFGRYDLVSAPVVNDRGRIVGRFTVDAAMDALRAESSLRELKSAGLSGDEDLFAAPWDSARNRWPWLGVNLVTAFAASRVIGQFEMAIQQLAALAALMPIVASIGGNTGNQTMALVIRALAVGQIQPSSARRLVRKEVVISLLNGTVWGVIVGIFAVLLYRSLSLGAVMTGAVVLNLLIAGLTGVAIPLGLHAAGRDPAHGSSVLLTFVTDAMGFFLFLGLAVLFLL
jgi:magnesium transporter